MLCRFVQCCCNLLQLCAVFCTVLCSYVQCCAVCVAVCCSFVQCYFLLNGGQTMGCSFACLLSLLSSLFSLLSSQLFSRRTWAPASRLGSSFSMPIGWTLARGVLSLLPLLPSSLPPFFLLALLLLPLPLPGSGCMCRWLAIARCPRILDPSARGVYQPPGFPFSRFPSAVVDSPLLMPQASFFLRSHEI